MSSTNAMKFGPAWMRDSSRPPRTSGQGIPDGAGGNSPLVPSTNGSSSFAAAPLPPDTSSLLHPPIVNGAPSTMSSSPAHGRTSSFSYSSILTSAQSNAPSTGDPSSGNGALPNHDKPFKYTREEMLSIWKSNAAKIKVSGIPLEFEKHDTFTSAEALDPVLLGEMSSAEREAFAGPINAEKDLSMQGRGDRPSRQFAPPKADRQMGIPNQPGGRAAPSSRARSNRSPFYGFDKLAISSPRTDTTAFPHKTPRPVKSREYFTGVFGGSSSTLADSPPEKDIWGSATKKGSFDEHGKFVVSDEVEGETPQSQGPEAAKPESAIVSELVLPEVPASEKLDPSVLMADELPSQIPDTFPLGNAGLSLGGLPAIGGRSTSRFSSFAGPEKHDSDAQDPLNALASRYNDDRHDDLNDILSLATDRQAITPPPIDQLSSAFAVQSLSSEPGPSNFTSFGGFESESRRGRDSSQLFSNPKGPSHGLFEHPVVPQQPTLPPAPPQTTRVMIMADKLKWVYKDPQGNIQGPFTGLEMHEWYRGGYFHVDLEVKREDDPVFEPLRSFVKRIGNQREPFLVPLPSKTQTQIIPPRSTTTLSGWNTTLFGEEESKSWPGQPPLPSLTGTTLTADQQNALERRKQEEQYLLVRQRELAQQQPPQGAIPPPLLQHNISPPYIPASAPHPPLPPPPPPPPTSAGFPGYQSLHSVAMGITHHVHTPAPVQVQTLPPLDALRNTSSAAQPPVPPQPPSIERHTNRTFVSPWGSSSIPPANVSLTQPQPEPKPEPLKEAVVPKEEDPEFSVEAITQGPELMPVPPPAQLEPPFPSSSSLVEGVVVAETDVSESSEELETSSIPIATSSSARIAPWAKDEPKKAALSLKQIQELEAKRVAEQNRKIALERQQAAALAAQVTIQSAQTTPVLPSTSTWGSVAAKGWTGAKVATMSSSLGKKTMAEIQKEEEEERAKTTKAKEPVTPPAWTVVGPGGRPQPGRPTPSGGVTPQPPNPSAIRSTSIDQKPAAPAPPPTKRVLQPNAVEDFQKWCRSQLKSLNDDEIYQMLLTLPPNEGASKEIISDTIYSHSPTLDGRHFAEEFLKRRKALGSALDSSVPPPATSSGSNSGGWNEVLKKEKKDASGEWNSAFKVVSGRKGRRRI